jgi:hypothetical protein
MRYQGDWTSILGAIAVMLLPVLIVSRSPVVLLGEASLVFAIALVVLTSTASGLRREGPSPFDDALGPTGIPQTRPEDLERMERLLAFARPGRADRDTRVAALLRSAVARRLRDRHTVDLARQPLAARRILGDELYELAREPDDLTEPDPLGGLTVSELQVLTYRIEEI